jgi:hypothetical protein
MFRFNILIRTVDFKEYSEDLFEILSPYSMSKDPIQDPGSEYIVFSAYDPINDSRHGLGERGIKEITDKLKRYNIKYEVVETLRYALYST